MHALYNALYIMINTVQQYLYAWCVCYGCLKLYLALYVILNYDDV